MDLLISGNIDKSTICKPKGGVVDRVVQSGKTNPRFRELSQLTLEKVICYWCNVQYLMFGGLLEGEGGDVLQSFLGD